VLGLVVAIIFDLFGALVWPTTTRGWRFGE